MNAYLTHGAKSTPTSSLKGDLCVTVWHVVAATLVAATLVAATLAAATLAAATLVATATAVASATAAFISTTQKTNRIRDDLSVVAIATIFVLPFSGLDAALNVQLLAFPAVLANIFSLAPEDHHSVPLGVIGPVAFTIFSTIRSGNPQSGHRRAAAGRPYFWVLSEVSNENGFVDSHKCSNFFLENSAPSPCDHSATNPFNPRTV
jgi:hypothetical protein